MWQGLHEEEHSAQCLAQLQLTVSSLMALEQNRTQDRSSTAWNHSLTPEIAGTELGGLRS